jgi:hypothetical protein
VGLKVDVEALPRTLIAALRAGQVDRILGSTPHPDAGFMQQVARMPGMTGC